MNWTLLQPLAAVKKSSVTLKLVIPAKRGKPSLQISIPTIIAKPFGLEEESIDYANVFIGKDGTETAGRLWVQPAMAGASKLRRLKRVIVITLPAPSGLKLDEQVSNVEPERAGDGGGFFLTLPDWARPGGDGLAPSKSAGEKPGALEFNGNLMIMGSRELRLPKQQAIVMAKLYEKFGKCVTKESLHRELYADDPNGGADTKILDIIVCKIREQIKDWPIVIHTHWGKGYELRRAVT